MASLGGVFDATQVAPSGTRVFIPAGQYPAQVLRTDIIPTKDGNGKFAWFEIEITDGEFKGCTLETRMNLWNQNEKAVEIAQRDLSALCHATGEMAVEDTDQLCFKPFQVVVKIKPKVMEADGVTQKYAEQSEVGGFKPVAPQRTMASAGAAFQPPQTRPVTPAQTQPVARPATPTPAANANASAPWKTAKQG